MAERRTNAVTSVEVCRSILAQEGQHQAAEALRGLDFIDQSTATLAKGILASIPVYGTIANTAKAEALDALDLALEDNGRDPEA